MLVQFSGRTVSDRHVNATYEHALSVGSYWDGEGWLIDGLNSEDDMDAMTVEAWTPLPDAYVGDGGSCQEAAGHDEDAAKKQRRADEGKEGRA